MHARARWLLAACALACGPQAESDDGVDTGTDETSAGTTMTAMTTAAATTTDGPDDTSSGTTEPDPDSSSGDPPGTSTGEPPGTTTTGETTGDATGEMGMGECTEHGECPSGYCREFSDAPPDPESLCQDPPAGTRFTGTLRDIVTGEPVVDADVVFVSALQAASNPQGAMALASATTNADGEFDTTVFGDINAQIGVVAQASSVDHYLTQTGVVSPQMGGDYPPGNTIHDVWAVDTDDLETWSDLLVAEGVDASDLPLGDSAGALLLVRDADGNPIPDATMISTDGLSQASVYYPAADGMSLVAQTSDLGIAIVLDSGLAEVFTVEVGGVSVGQRSVVGTTGAMYTAGVIDD